MVDNIFFSQFICYSAITVTTFAFIINSANFRLYFCVFVRFWIIKLFAVIVVGAARYFGISMSRPTLCSCLSSHITCAFSLAVPSRQPRYSIFLSMHFLHEVAALRQLNPLLPFFKFWLSAFLCSTGCTGSATSFNIESFFSFFKVDSFPRGYSAMWHIKLSCHFSLTQFFLTHSFYNHYFKFRCVSLVWLSFWHKNAPFRQTFYWYTSIIPHCLTKGEHFIKAFRFFVCKFISCFTLLFMVK